MTECMMFVGMFVAMVVVGEVVTRVVTRPRRCAVEFRPLIEREG